MKIALSFKEQFEWETLQSEKLRAAILASYSILSCINLIVVTYLINHDVSSHLKFDLPGTLLFFLSALAVYEIVTYRVLNTRLKNTNKMHPYFKYVNAFIEMTIITVMLYVYTMFFKYSSILSDIVLASLYYLIVFLSPFYLDRIISVVTGFIAACAYIFFHIADKNHNITAGSVIEEILYNNYFVYATGVLLFLCGIAAAFMAYQLKKGIQRAVELVEDENKMFNLFSRQISKEIATELLDNEGNVPSELRFVTVMFIDIRNFTVYAETQQPADIVKFQNKYFALVTEVVHKYQGIVNQFLGDGCMVTFGAPVKVTNSSQNAINAALEIRKKIEESILRNEMHPFKIGVGIHCGDAVTGNIGTEVKSEYSITGGVVILAARIEQVNKVLNSEILVSKDVLQHADINELSAQNMGAAHLKGWSHDVELYKLA
ncbi:adenylate/guanylate cyclase domain-containing protein [soil metagenome]